MLQIIDFNHPITNAYMESLNNLICVTNRLGRGYSFEALRVKMLFSEGVHKVIQPRPKFQRGDESMSMNYAMFSFEDSLPSTRTVKRAKNYGADISTLARMIEHGEI